MNFVLAAGSIPAPIQFSFDGFVLVAIGAALFVPFFVALQRTPVIAAMAVAPAADPPPADLDSLDSFDAPAQRAA